MPSAALLAATLPLMEDMFYVPTRKGARPSDLLEIGVVMQSPQRIIAKDCVGPIRVSTVFLCTNHSFGEGPPVLWETMLFSDGGDCDVAAFLGMGYGPDDAMYLGQEQWRYRSRKEAAEHHAKLVGMLRAGLN
jgi:hypothetical protein